MKSPGNGWLVGDPVSCVATGGAVTGKHEFPDADHQSAFSARTASRDDTDLSVVIITYNEADRIGECLDSVFAACSEWLDFEVILVDSNSTDGTVDIAVDYPITVLQIPDDDLTTPAAGRHVGTIASLSDTILFVDGDMSIHREWLESAMAYLDERPGVAAVDGQLNEPAAEETVQSVDAVRGVALYHKDALLSVGGFDPYLQSLEDIHLGFKLTHAGYDLRRLPTVAGHHPIREGVTEPIRRWKRGYMTGTGQAIRESTTEPTLLVKHLLRLRYHLITLGWVLVGVFSLLSPPVFLVWVILSTIAYAVVATKLGIGQAFRFFFGKLVGTIGLIRGLFKKPLDATSFPHDRIRLVQRGPVHRVDE